MRVFGQCSRMRRTNRRKMSTHHLAIWRLPRAQHCQHALAGVGDVDMDRQDAPLIVMGIEHRQLLMAMHGVGGVVDIERDRLGRASR